MPQISQQNQYQLNLFLCEFRCSRKNVGKNSCFGVPVFRGLEMPVFFVGLGTMMPTFENWPVKTIKTAFLIKRAKSANSPVYLRDLYVIAHRITDVRDITCGQPKYIIPFFSTVLRFTCCFDGFVTRTFFRTN